MSTPRREHLRCYLVWVQAEREEGFVLQSKSVPIIEAVKRWDSDAGEKVFKDMKKNENFVNEVRTG